MLRTLSALALLAAPVHADVLVQSTTSTANSGLYDHLLPIFTDETGIDVNVVAVGTGQAIKNAMNCDGDVLLVHAKAREEAFVAEGYGTERRDVMYNDFVIVGPEADPAGINGEEDASAALTAIAEAEAPFVSRGDNSGTHTAELSLWDAAGMEPEGAWYRETGSGMGATLNVGVGMGAYALTDRATWVTFGNKGDIGVLVQGDPALFNQYGVIPVSVEACPSVNVEEAQVFADWLVSDAGQQAIGAFTVEGEQLFVPNAE
ncbi:substrate-binding domain-containing protein [Palleronia sp. THAF1]|uniref:substrate-binding domain-containing protein n=1 Tax=Palleronia sp. THAF1 TaxID=2587842 RepID=UPI000F51CB0A|nr:substrate-binding domain-containing protein [Palleronia sp. THAF1]